MKYFSIRICKILCFNTTATKFFFLFFFYKYFSQTPTKHLTKNKNSNLIKHKARAREFEYHHKSPKLYRRKIFQRVSILDIEISLKISEYQGIDITLSITRKAHKNIFHKSFFNEKQQKYTFSYYSIFSYSSHKLSHFYFFLICRQLMKGFTETFLLLMCMSFHILIGINYSRLHVTLMMFQVS